MSREFGFIKDLKKDLDICKVGFRVLDSWIVTASNGQQHLELIIGDAKGDTVHVITRHADFQQLKSLIEENHLGYAVAEGGPVRERRLGCCGIGCGWFLFIMGFFPAAIPWYVGAIIMLCSRVDCREKPDTSLVLSLLTTCITRDVTFQITIPEKYLMSSKLDPPESLFVEIVRTNIAN